LKIYQVLKSASYLFPFNLAVLRQNATIILRGYFIEHFEPIADSELEISKGD